MRWVYIYNVGRIHRISMFSIFMEKKKIHRVFCSAPLSPLPSSARVAFPLAGWCILGSDPWATE